MGFPHREHSCKSSLHTCKAPQYENVKLSLSLKKTPILNSLPVQWQNNNDIRCNKVLIQLNEDRQFLRLFFIMNANKHFIASFICMYYKLQLLKRCTTKSPPNTFSVWSHYSSNGILKDAVDVQHLEG